ncbi:MAG: YihY/virulence factor BrkB family protein [Candidatus Obscuribacterales bacterium]|nr:YihY/virulence factor BrkB family protein [Steroidobacteraceae bacterium]
MAIFRLLDRTEQWLFANDGLGRVAKPLRYVYALLHDLFRGELTLRAMSLVYTTLLSIVPLVALAFSVVKGLGYHRDLEPVLYQILEPIGDKAYQITNQVMQFIENVREGVLGSLGLVILLYTSISMIQKIEESFNFVWRVKEPRSLGRRVSEYLSVLIIGPVLLIAVLSALAALSNAGAVRAISAIAPFGRALAALGTITPYVIVACVFAVLYGLVPNTKVRARAAIIGGAAAGILWALSGAMFASIVVHARGAMLIYAGFAFIVLALFWVYLSWLILLLGAQLAYYVQHPHSLRPGSGIVHLTNSLAERLALSTMYLIAQSFADTSPIGGSRWSLNKLAERLNVAGVTLQPVTERLEAAGLLVATEDESLVPARDLNAITIVDVFDAARSDSEDRKFTHVRSLATADAIARTAVQTMRESLKGKTLKDWIGEGAK